MILLIERRGALQSSNYFITSYDIISYARAKNRWTINSIVLAGCADSYAGSNGLPIVADTRCCLCLCAG